MKLKLVRHLWGYDKAQPLAPHLARWREVGYEAVEVSLRTMPDPAAFHRFLKESGMAWVPQVFTNGVVPGGTVREHIDSFRVLVEECLDHNPLFINAHSGSDRWSPAEAEEFYGLALDVEKRAGIPIAHETHRLRTFAIPWQMHHILELYPDLRVTCDFSHWVCVCERLLPDLGDTIALAARHCYHIHARVGFEQGPQVPDPAAPEYAVHLKAHESWWKQIWLSQQARGFEVSTLTPEFGPAPYLHMLPYTNVPVADLPRICDWMAARQRQHFNEVTGGNDTVGP